MKLVTFLCIIFQFGFINAQTSTKQYIDSIAMIKCNIVKYKSYILLNIENFGKKSVYIPDLFRVDNGCERMECYLTNKLERYVFVEEEVDIIKIKPNHDWGFIYKVLVESDFQFNELFIDYSCKKVERQKIIHLIDRMKRSHPIKVE